MNSILKWLAGNSLIQAWIMGLVRHGATALGAALTAWLVAHNADPTAAGSLAQEVSAALVAVASIAWAMWDKSNVSDKIQTATTAGVNAGQILAGAPPDPQLQVDKAMTEKVAQAISTAAQDAPQTKADALARLRSGT